MSTVKKPIIWKKKTQIRKTFSSRLNPYKILFLKRRKLFILRKKAALRKKNYKGPKPRPYFRYKFNKWKYTFLKKNRYYKEKNRWFAYINLFKKYLNYRYGINSSLIKFLRQKVKIKTQKLFFFGQNLESRLSSVLVRAGCVMNFREAFWLIKNKHIGVNSTSCLNLKYFLQPTDWITVFYLTIKNEKYRLLRFTTTYKNLVTNVLKFYSGYSFLPKKYGIVALCYSFLQISFFKSQVIFINKPTWASIQKHYWLYNFLLYQY